MVTKTDTSKEKSTPKFKKKNLVALVFTPNECYTEVVSLRMVDIQLDLERGVWSYHSCTGTYNGEKETPIGSGRYISEKSGRSGIIGIYDRTKIKHLDSMINDVEEVTRNEGSLLED